MKQVKMMLYGDPGVGKSTFALGFPKPYFITTDGNYEWLEDFGAKEEDHTQVDSWEQAKKVFALDFEGYDTIVIDLTEDLFKWDELEFCTQKKIDHISDLGYGKGYDITRNEFFIEMCKLIAKPKHILFISHEELKVVKDRRGVEHTVHRPSNRIPDKVMDMLEGRLRYVVRCYLKGEEQEDGSLIKKRYLSLIPKENEYGIVRGIDENKVPHDIPLDAKLFLNIIGINSNSSNSNKSQEPKETIKKVDAPLTSTKTLELKINLKEQPKKAIIKEAKVEEAKVEEPKEIKVEPKKEVIEEPKKEAKVEEVKKEEPKVEEDKVEVKKKPTLEDIKAKLALLKAQRNKEGN